MPTTRGLSIAGERDIPDARAVRVTAYPFERDAVDISELVVQMDWTESADLAAIEGTLTLDNGADMAHRILAPGTWLRVSMLDPETKRWGVITPMLYVWGRAFTDRFQNRIELQIFDICSFLQRQGEADFFFRKTKTYPRGWRASDIAESILFDLEIDAEVAPTRYRIPYLLLRSVTPYEAIVKALMADKNISGVRYRVRAGRYDAVKRTMTDLDKIIVEPAIKTDLVWTIRQGSNLFSLTWEETLEGKATDVVGIAVSSNGKETARVRAVSKDVRRYGRLRRNLLMQPRASAVALEREVRQQLVKQGDLNRKITIQAEGIPFMRAADAVFVQETGSRLSGTFFVTSVSHSLVAGAHTMNVELARVAAFPESEVSDDELKPQERTAAGEPVTGQSGPTSGVSFTGDYSWAQTLASRFGLRLSSTYRSPAVNARTPGAAANSAHMQRGRAADFAGSASAMLALAKWAVQNIGQFQEIYYDPYGGWKNGVSIGAIGRHSDHVHLTIRETAVGTSSTTPVEVAPVGGNSEVPGDEWVFSPGQLDSIETGGSGASSDRVVGSSNYPGDNASKTALARWMGAGAQEYGLPPELPVMAALAESGLTNHKPYFDVTGDAMGFFSIHRERASGDGYDWEQMRRRPALQLEWFIKEANKLKSKWASRGVSGYHGWIQDIEKSANSSGSQYAAQYSRAKELLGVSG